MCISGEKLSWDTRRAREGGAGLHVGAGASLGGPAAALTTSYLDRVGGSDDQGPHPGVLPVHQGEGGVRGLDR